MKINKYIDKEWFRVWWKDFRSVLWLALALFIFYAICEVILVIYGPTIYNTENSGSYTGKCYQIETRVEKRWSLRGWRNKEYTFLHMSNGQIQSHRFPLQQRRQMQA